MPPRYRSTFLVARLLGGALSLAFCATGCAAEELDHADPQDTLADDEDALQQVQQPSGPRFRVTELRTTGSGCPLGTVTAATTPFNNYSLDWEFTDYGISLDESVNLSVKECLIKFRLHSEQPTSYRIERVISQAWATLDPGNTAKHFVHAYMQGNAPTEETRKEQTGPFEGVITPIGTGSSSRRCGNDEWLIVGTRLVVNRTAPGLARLRMVASGWIELFPSSC